MVWSTAWSPFCRLYWWGRWYRRRRCLRDLQRVIKGRWIRFKRNCFEDNVREEMIDSPLNPNINLSVVFLSVVWCNILQLWQPWHKSNQQIEFLPGGGYRYKCVWHFVTYRLWITRAEQEIESWWGVWRGRWRWDLFHLGGSMMSEAVTAQCGLLVQAQSLWDFV